MVKAKDIRFDDITGDLFIDPITGDFDIVKSDTRHVQDIIEAASGWYKEFPLLGVNLKAFNSATGSVQHLTRKTKLQLRADGYQIDNLEVKNNQIYVTGNRKDGNL